MRVVMEGESVEVGEGEKCGFRRRSAIAICC